MEHKLTEAEFTPRGMVLRERCSSATNPATPPKIGSSSSPSPTSQRSWIWPRAYADKSELPTFLPYFCRTVNLRQEQRAEIRPPMFANLRVVDARMSCGSPP